MGASLQTSFVTLDEAMKVTNRRVNALENVTIPRIQGVLDYISRELDELEREDFTRLKLVQSAKQALIREQDELKAKLIKAGKLKAKEDHNQADITAQYDAQDDEDVVF